MSDVTRYIPWGGLLLALMVVVLRRRSRARAMRREQEQSGSAVDPAVLVEDLRTYDRARALFTAPDGSPPAATSDLNIALHGGAMEVGHSEGRWLLVALEDGRVALYTHGGPSMHGLGAIPAVRSAAEAFRASIESHAEQFLPDPTGKLPEQDWVVIRTRTDRGCVAVRSQLLVSGEGPCAEVFRRGFDLRDAIVASAT